MPSTDVWMAKMPSWAASVQRATMISVRKLAPLTTAWSAQAKMGACANRARQPLHVNRDAALVQREQACSAAANPEPLNGILLDPAPERPAVLRFVSQGSKRTI